VRVRDAETGAAVTVAGLRASIPPGENRPRSPVSIGDAGDVFDFRWPPGRVRLGVIGGFRIAGSFDFDVASGANDLELRMRRGCGASIRLLDAGTPRAWDAATFAGSTAIRLEEPADSHRWCDGDVLTWHFAEPGLWRLAFPPIPGFEPLPPLDVDVPADHFLERALEAVRQR
jgi:hypothetical protein